MRCVHCCGLGYFLGLELSCGAVFDSGNGFEHNYVGVVGDDLLACLTGEIVFASEHLLAFLKDDIWTFVPHFVELGCFCFDTYSDC